MTPNDQKQLRECLGMRPLLDEFMEASEISANTEWFRRNCALFLRVCDAHGRTAAQHHQMLVKRYIERPADSLADRRLRQITASGPPLPDLMEALRRLHDLRTAAARDDIATSCDKLNALRAMVAPETATTTAAT